MGRRVMEPFCAGRVGDTRALPIGPMHANAKCLQVLQQAQRGAWVIGLFQTRAQDM